MKKNRKRKAGKRAARQRTRNVPHPKPAPIAARTFHAESSRTWWSDDHTTFALLNSPILIVACALAANVAVQSNVSVPRNFTTLLQSNAAIIAKPYEPATTQPKFIGAESIIPTQVRETIVAHVQPQEILKHRANSVAHRLVSIGSRISARSSPTKHLPPISNGAAVLSVDAQITEHARTTSQIQVATTARTVSRIAHNTMALPARSSMTGESIRHLIDGLQLTQQRSASMARTSLTAPALALTALLNSDTHINPEDDSGVCRPVTQSASRQSAFLNRENAQKHDAHIFGSALARAAHQQTQTFVVYNAKYISINYPMGDVPALYGVCTDVIIRAYRALGIDLQQLVHKSRIGNRDKSINHRRVKTLKSFFERYASTLQISNNPKDFAPGDIVTYYRPQSTGTHMHIAIVANIKAPSGSPMLIHNRGHGPQLEDALFFDEITGHFRYTGPGHKKREHTVASARPEPTRQ